MPIGPNKLTSDDDERSSQASSSEDDDDDQTWDDWVADSDEEKVNKTKSLFDAKVFDSADAAIQYDATTHGVDLNKLYTRLGLDEYGRIRLVNYIRKTEATPAKVSQIDVSEFAADVYLIPAIPDDPLLLQSGDSWSDSEGEEGNTDPATRIKLLEQKLLQSQRDLESYRKLVVEDRLGLLSGNEPQQGPSTSKQPRDDDTHYFDSYAENEIHSVMIQDQVRTSTYANFILTNPSLFRDAIVLDVGCGTGILSLFAARAGAKRVIAVDASNIALKAERIVKANNFDHIITVVRGKVEDIQLPEGIDHVDVIISEWMGYALLYESMLDSVLVARDRFLRPETGVMAPSQTTMMLALGDASDVIKERVTFWGDVYGFDLSAMGEGTEDEAIVAVVQASAILSKPAIVNDIHTGSVTIKKLDFSSPFTLTSTVERKTKVTSFILYFDTFFTVSGEPIPPGTRVKNISSTDAVLAEVWPVGGKPANQRRASQSHDLGRVTSFSTGPESIPTHWKQTLFLLKEPFIVEEGSVVTGTFYCRKSESNSRELEVEIHYTVGGKQSIQFFKVR